MAKTALTQLQEQIDAVRAEAYQAGYAAAMQAVRDFAARQPPAAPATPAAAPPQEAPRPARRGRRPTATVARIAGRRPRRGTNAQMIAEILEAIAPRAARPAEIRQALRRDKGVDIAFTSIRHALGQLQARRAVEPGGDTKTWRYLGSGVLAC